MTWASASLPPITRSTGTTPTERFLAALCERTFHKLWSYPTPFKEDAKELCDLIAVFDEHVFIFFDRESRKFEAAGNDISLSWARWKKEAIDKQIVTARGAEKYIKSGRGIFLDPKKMAPFPLTIPQNAQIHKLVVAHGAKDACVAFSDQNVYGSLAIFYGERVKAFPFPFVVDLERDDIVHVLDSHNLELIFANLDTVFDFTSYIVEKERAIRSCQALVYCGEEDLVAHYLSNYDEAKSKYVIRPRDDDYNSLMIGEGEWKEFSLSERYRIRQEANKISYLWDELIQRTCQNALDGTILGEADLLKGPSALHEMAREPRFSRRGLSTHMIDAIRSFPESSERLVRNLSFMPSFYR